jgi:hypothetical protein
MPNKEEPEISARLRKRWAGYAAAAAGAACIAPAAQASIIYQPEHYTVPVNGGGLGSPPIGEFFTSLDFECLGHNGSFCFSWFRGRNVGAGPGFAQGTDMYRYQMLHGFEKGSLIGASQKFGSGLFVFSRSGPFSNTHRVWNGGEFLGFELPLGGGQYNFGWAQVSFQDSSPPGAPYPGQDYGSAIHINGYAYETTPNVPIRAGQTVPEPGTLSLLALGSLGLGLWRKRKAA